MMKLLMGLFIFGVGIALLFQIYKIISSPNIAISSIGRIIRGEADLGELFANQMISNLVFGFSGYFLIKSFKESVAIPAMILSVGYIFYQLVIFIGAWRVSKDSEEQFEEFIARLVFFVLFLGSSALGGFIFLLAQSTLE